MQLEADHSLRGHLLYSKAARTMGVFGKLMPTMGFVGREDIFDGSVEKMAAHVQRGGVVTVFIRFCASTLSPLHPPIFLVQSRTCLEMSSLRRRRRQLLGEAEPVFARSLCTSGGRLPLVGCLTACFRTLTWPVKAR